METPIQPTTLSHKLRKGMLRILIALLVLCVIMQVQSVTLNVIRTLYVATVAWVMLTGIVVMWQATARRRWFRGIAVFIAILIAAWVTWGDKPVNTAGLRQAYLARLRTFSGTRYMWGGETHVGIDCSGLARMALWEAMLERGIMDGNPRLLGWRCWQFWWQDVGARNLEDGKYGYTSVIGYAERLATYDHAMLQPGDLAIAGHMHVLIYLGDRQWIEASPEDGKVVINRATPKINRSYFQMPATLVRWRMLEE